MNAVVIAICACLVIDVISGHASSSQASTQEELTSGLRSYLKHMSEKSKHLEPLQNHSVLYDALLVNDKEKDVKIDNYKLSSQQIVKEINSLMADFRYNIMVSCFILV